MPRDVLGALYTPLGAEAPVREARLSRTSAFRRRVVSALTLHGGEFEYMKWGGKRVHDTAGRVYVVTSGSTKTQLEADVAQQDKIK